MAVQITHAPVNLRRTTAAISIARYLWMRYARRFQWIASAWLVSAIFDHFLYAGKVSSFLEVAEIKHVVTVALIPGMLIMAPIFAVSEFDESFWTLPIRTRALINWLMLYGAGGSALCWIASAICIWRPAGLNAPILWPIAALVAAQAAMLGCRCIMILSINLIVGALDLGILAGGYYLGMKDGASGAEFCAGYLALASLMYAVAIAAAARTRCGEMSLSSNWQKFLKLPERITPFASGVQAQTWFELRTEAVTPAAIYTLVGFLSLLTSLPVQLTMQVWPIALLTKNAHHLYTNGGFPLSIFNPIMSLPLVSIFWISSMAAARNRARARAAFPATQPISCVGWVAAKLRAATAGTAIAWGIQFTFALMWMMIPAWLDGRRTLLGPALWRALTPLASPHAVGLVIGAMLIVVYLTWKAQADALYLIASGRLPQLRIAALVIAGACYYVVYPEVIQLYAYQLKDWPLVSREIGSAAFYALAIGTPVKAALTAVVVAVLVRRRLLTAAALRRTLVLWSAAALLFTALLSAALAPYHIAWWQTALGVALLMPGVRLALAPLALAWDRSR